MKRILLIVLTALLLCRVAAAQGVLITGNGVPVYSSTQSCAGVTYLNLSTGLFYQCSGSAWSPLTFTVPPPAGSSTITTVGTITSGTWTGTVIADNMIAAALTGKSYAGTTVAMTGAITSSGGGIGYAAGAGGTVTQLTSKSTGVTLNKLTGTITLNGAALAAGTIVTLTVTDSAVAATDVPVAIHDSVGTIGGYTIAANTPAAGSFKISVRNNTAASLSEAIVIRFAVIKSVVN